jgi:hypothetical protein
MRRSMFLTAIVAGLFAAQASAECERPEMIQVPDGRSSTLEQMLETQGAVRSYLAEMEEFLACLNEEIDAAPEDTPQEVTTALIDRHNAGVTEMEAVAAKWNQERVAYQEANPSK